MSRKIDLEDLSKLVRLEKEIAELHVEYINKGFTVTEVATTFAQIYFDQFERALDNESIKLLNQEMANHHRREPLSSFDLASNVCIRLSTGFIKAVNSYITKKK